MPFKPGQSGNPAGKLPGTKNKSYLNTDHWLKYADEDIQTFEVGDPKRATIWKWAAELIMSKVQVLPATPGESASNAQNAFGLMNGLAPIVPPVEPQPSANGGHPANGS